MLWFISTELKETALTEEEEEEEVAVAAQQSGEGEEREEEMCMKEYRSEERGMVVWCDKTYLSIRNLRLIDGREVIYKRREEGVATNKRE